MRIQDHFSISVTLMLATASAQVCVPLGHSSLYYFFCGVDFSTASTEKNNQSYGILP